MFNVKSVAVSAMALLAGVGTATAQDLEVTHWWTSGGEAAAVSVFAKRCVVRQQRRSAATS